MYLNGEWAEAKLNFEETLLIKSDDGPTKNKLEFMEENDNCVPPGWEGHCPFVD